MKNEKVIPVPTKEQLLDWIITESISVQFGYPMGWTDPNGSTYRTDWLIDSPTARFATYPTIEESLEKAYDTYYRYEELQK